MTADRFLNINTEFLDEQPVFCFTSDVDWASECAIRKCQNIFSNRSIRPTYFVTHESEYLREVWRNGGAEFGCHPNFLPGSDHGQTYEEVCDFFNRFPKEWRICFRSHRFFDVTDINVGLAGRGFKYDSNTFAFYNKLPPYRHFSGLIRFPSCWEDGTHLRYIANLEKEPLLRFLDRPGLTIMGVHPLHMAINSPTFYYNRMLKDRLTREEMVSMDDDAIAKVRSSEFGIADLFESILDHVVNKGYRTMTLSELYGAVVEAENG